MTALILTVLVKASLIMAAAATAALLSRRASAARRHMLLVVSIVALLALPVLTAMLPSLSIPVPAGGPVNRLASAASEIDAPRAIQPAPRTAPTSTPQAVSVSPSVASSAALPWGTILLAVYLAGTFVLAIKLVSEQLAIRRLARQSTDVTDPEWTDLIAACRRETGISQPVRLLRSLDRTMPMAFGVMKPAIMIPSVADTWTLDRRRAVLLHELAHIARRDCLTQLIARLACALYWPHPGAWLIARRLRMERELACDDRVLSIGTAAPDYAQHLLELAYSLGGYRAPALVVSMARPKQLEGRMLAVLDHARNRTVPAARSRTAAFAIAALIVAPLAAAELGTPPDLSTFVAEKGAAVPGTTAPAPAPEQRSATTQRRAREVSLPGTWSLRASQDPKNVNLQLIERRDSMNGFNIAISALQGLSPAALAGSGGPVKFALRRDAGTINFEGSVRSGVGAGTFDFTPNPAFVAEMTKRGYERPTNDELYILARGDIGTAYLDELASQKYARPSLDDLLRAGDHGADLDYLREMGRAGYRLGQIESLIKTRDHGVDIEFIDGLKSHGLSGLTIEQLVRARDHGVDPEYIAGMKKAGFDLRDLEGLVQTRDHGVDPEYISAMRNAGYDLHDLQGLIRARDHGIDREYIDSMRRHGYKLALAELINARDHGVDDEYVSGMAGLGYRDLTIGELVRLRDHGVTPEWTKQQNNRGVKLSVDELIRRRDRGGDN